MMCKHLTEITIAFINAHVLVCLSCNSNIPYHLFCFVVIVYEHIYVYMARDKACAFESEHS